MKFKIATGFDSKKHDEVFHTVDFSDEALHEIVTGVLNQLDYDQRTNLLDRLEKEKKVTVGPADV